MNMKKRTDEVAEVLGAVLAERARRRVSTVWLGLDHGLCGKPPLIFETMVFEHDEGEDVFCARWSVEEHAVAGHRATLDQLRAGVKPSDVAVDGVLR